MAGTSRPIGAVLLDQSVVSGVGNVLRAEVLSVARIHPSTPANRLTRDALARLWEELVTLMRRSKELGRIRTIDADAELPDADTRFVYKQERCRRCGTRVEGFEAGAVVTEGGAIAADLVVLGLGVVPNSRLALDAGIDTGVKGAIKVDVRQRTSAEGVWAAGDCCESFHVVSRRPVHIALGTVANKQGRVAGIDIGGGYATFPGVTGTAVTKVCNTEVGRTGLTAHEAEAVGFRFEAVTIESTTRAAYFPGAGRITVKVLAERRSGRLLGAQLVGVEGAAKRVDVFATAITAGMAVEEMTALDLSYAPPFAPVWDPVLIAARQAAGAVHRAETMEEPRRNTVS
jgi:NADPH-dependent 2,4-dienoyl-CoA reductase/sulfur reductase-like enzyme